VPRAGEVEWQLKAFPQARDGSRNIVRCGRLLVPERFWATFAKPPQPSCELDFRVVRGQVECIAVTAENGLTGSQLRALPLGEINRRATALVALKGAPGGGGYVHAAGTVEEYEAVLAKTDRRRPHDDEFLRAITATYRQARRDGRNPAQAVAASGNYAEAYARRLIQEARERHRETGDPLLLRAAPGPRRAGEAPLTRDELHAVALAKGRAWRRYELDDERIARQWDLIDLAGTPTHTEPIETGHEG
jgi:hypothetical protein